MCLWSPGREHLVQVETWYGNLSTRPAGFQGTPLGVRLWGRLSESARVDSKSVVVRHVSAAFPGQALSPRNEGSRATVYLVDSSQPREEPLPVCLWGKGIISNCFHLNSL